MESEFRKYILQNKLIESGDSILLTISGGIDSMIMLNLFQKIKLHFNLKIGICHINFNLRGNESNLDQKFVESVAKANKIPFFTKNYETSKYSIQNKIGIQEAARILRYNYFKEVAEKNNFNKIATGHNFNDNAETIFLNILRGANINGLCGIPIKRNSIIRPLLFAKRKEILAYALKNKLKWREDKSNKSNKYKRNLIRNNIFPKIEKFYNITDALNNLSKSANKIHFEIENYLNKIKYKIVKKNNSEIRIKISEILKINSIYRDSLFYDILCDENIEQSAKKIETLNFAISSETGSRFEIGSDFILLKDRNNLIIRKNEKHDNTFILIEKKGVHKFDDFKLSISNVKSKKIKYYKSRNIEIVDAEKLIFPLTIRNWEKCDYFYPIGLNGRKKLSDYFINNKISDFEKNNIKILVSNNQIVWVMGFRIDDRFKVDSQTKNILKLNFNNYEKKYNSK